jgi:hypothetical protein
MGRKVTESASTWVGGEDPKLARSIPESALGRCNQPASGRHPVLIKQIAGHLSLSLPDLFRSLAGAFVFGLIALRRPCAGPRNLHHPAAPCISIMH